jgi:CheY-like chemotaxis protein
LTAIIGAAELLTGEQLGERSRLYVQTISESAEGLFALINSILDFSKIEAGGLNLHLKTVQIESVVESAADAVANLARENGISVYTYVDPLIPSVHGDGDCLRQILLNLLGNAVKFTEHGQIVARVYPTEVSDKDVKLRFEVQDTGIGILPQEVSRLFEPFAQVDSSPARRFGGTGLGLSISKRMVELMGGEIGVHSEPGVGSRFWFTVPFARAIELSPTPNRSLDGVAALVISGDELFVQIIERYLMSWLITCRSVNTAVDIVKALEPGDPRSWVAVVDLDTVEGREASHAVQVARAILGTRVITVGGDGPFRKPVRQSYLFDAIVNACAGESCPVSAAPPTRTRTKTTSSVSLDAPVLIAEDNVRLQPLLKLQFDQLGIPMTLVSDGQEALDAVRQTSYAMVFMDCQMPNVDGLSATRAIRAEELQSGLHIPIIAMTADAFAEDRDACFAAGMDDYLAKPVRVADLGAMIERWCRRSAAPRQV